MTLQTEYNFQNRKTLQYGQCVFAGLGHEFHRTGYKSDATPDIEFGSALVYDGASSNTRVRVKSPDAAGQTFIGVALFDHKEADGPAPFYRDAVTASPGAVYRSGDDITFATEDPGVQVYCDTAVDPTQPVFMRHTDGATAEAIAGTFSTTADAGNCDDISAFARWQSTTNTAGPAILIVDAKTQA
ncbi:MAG: hypothetical protein AAFY15_04055 [Cyanobacteria bacterium J06648_11]